MKNAPTIHQLFERQAKQIKAAKASKPAPTARTLPKLILSRPAAGEADTRPHTEKLASNALRKAAQIQRERTAKTTPIPARKAATKAAPAPSMRNGAALSFDHLAPAPFEIADETEHAARSKASAIVAAAAKARTPTGTNIPAPTGFGGAGCSRVGWGPHPGRDQRRETQGPRRRYPRGRP